VVLGHPAPPAPDPDPTPAKTVFDGGPGRVAIHGRGGASLLDPLGTARSHGCVRVANALVRWMARTLQPGTPVTIR
jgi:lipoprotein-anchoring transpeptidase ErfK/SrfK